MTMTMQVPNDKEMKRKTRCTLKQGKIKIEDMSSRNFSVMVIKDNKMFMKTGNREVKTMNIPIIGNIYQSPGISQYTKDYSMVIDKLNSDEASSLYVLVLTPKAKTLMSFKMKMTVDYSKGIVKRAESYSPDGKLISVMENKEFDNIGNVWVVRRTENKIISPLGEMKIEMLYENIQINGGVNDEEFEIK